MTFEKHQREAKKKRKAEEKRALRRKKKQQAMVEPTEAEAPAEIPIADEPMENGS